MFPVPINACPSLSKPMAYTISWPLVQRKRTFIGYPVFVVARNFSMAMGYTVALVAIAVRKLEGKKIAWDNI